MSPIPDYGPGEIGDAVAALLNAGVPASKIADAFNDNPDIVVDACLNENPREDDCFFCEYEQTDDPGERGSLKHKCSFHEKG